MKKVHTLYIEVQAHLMGDKLLILQYFIQWQAENIQLQL